MGDHAEPWRRHDPAGQGAGGMEASSSAAGGSETQPPQGKTLPCALQQADRTLNSVRALRALFGWVRNPPARASSLPTPSVVLG